MTPSPPLKDGIFKHVLTLEQAVPVAARSKA